MVQEAGHNPAQRLYFLSEAPTAQTIHASGDLDWHTGRHRDPVGAVVLEPDQVPDRGPGQRDHADAVFCGHAVQRSVDHCRMEDRLAAFLPYRRRLSTGQRGAIFQWGGW